MAIRLNGVEIEGLRGINSPVRLDFSGGVNLLVGENGTGKTSILQSIEWCITGKIPSFSGPEFSKEDALVNLFHSAGEARVSLFFQDEKGKAFSLERKRTMKKSTSSGKNPLTLTISGKTYEDEDAIPVLSRFLGIDYYDFSKYCYLHQDDVRKILSEEPEERSESIDRLLGTIQLRELSQAIDVKRKINSTINALDSQKNEIKRIDIEAVNERRKRTNAHKASLLKKGYSENDLSEEAGRGLSLEVLRQLETEAKRLGTSTKITEEEIGSLQLSDALDQLEKQTTDIDRSRISAGKKNLDKKTDLDKLKSQHKYYQDQTQELRGTSIDESTEKTRLLAGETKSLEDEQSQLSSVHDRLTQLEHDLNQSERLLERTEKELETLSERTTSDLEEEIRLAKERYDATENELSRFSQLARIQELSVAYLQSNPMGQCPVCNQEINVRSLLATLEEKGRTEIAQRVKELEHNRANLMDTMEQKKQKIRNIEQTQESVARIKEGLQKTISEVEHVSGQKARTSQDLEKILKDIESRQSTLSSTLNDKRTQKSRLESVVNALRSSLTQLDDIEKSIRSRIGVKSKGLDLISDLDAEVRRLENDNALLQDTKILDRIRARIMSLREIAEYLNRKQELKTMEEEATKSSRLLQDIESKIQQLENLRGSLEAIQGVILQQLKSETTATINKLGLLLNQYYGAVMGHTYFTSLDFETDSKKPLIYNVRGASADRSHKTYLPTRFSTAQMNATAIALFLSLNHSMLGENGLIIMDDPSQSMDEEHKAALAKLLSGLSEKRQIILATQDTRVSDGIKACSPSSLTVYNFKKWTTDGPTISTK